jgi:hypothetical protein
MKAKPHSKISNVNKREALQGEQNTPYAENPKKIYWAEKHSQW